MWYALLAIVIAALVGWILDYRRAYVTLQARHHRYAYEAATTIRNQRFDILALGQCADRYAEIDRLQVRKIHDQARHIAELERQLDDKIIQNLERELGATVLSTEQTKAIDANVQKNWPAA